MIRMNRVQKILLICLGVVLLFSLTAWAAKKVNRGPIRFGRINGPFGSAQVYLTNYYNQKMEAWIKNSKGKKVIRFKDRYAKKSYKIKGAPDFRSYQYPYKFNMGKLPAGKYSFTTQHNYITDTVVFNYAKKPVFKYKYTKAVRNNNGDMMQRFFFMRGNLKGKRMHVQIFDKKDRMVYSRTVKSGDSTQNFVCGWNGWPTRNAARRCPKGMYRLKYWADGFSPRTVNFRLAI